MISANARPTTADRHAHQEVLRNADSPSRAAILAEAGKPVQVEDIVIDPPGPGEVLIKLVASGVCHTDLHVKNMNGME